MLQTIVDAHHCLKITFSFIERYIKLLAIVLNRNFSLRRIISIHLVRQRPTQTIEKYAIRWSIFLCFFFFLFLLKRYCNNDNATIISKLKAFRFIYLFIFWLIACLFDVLRHMMAASVLCYLRKWMEWHGLKRKMLGWMGTMFYLYSCKGDKEKLVLSNILLVMQLKISPERGRVGLFLFSIPILFLSLRKRGSA